MQTDHLEENIVPNEGHLVQGASGPDLWSGIFPTRQKNLFLKTTEMWKNVKTLCSRKNLIVDLVKPLSSVEYLNNDEEKEFERCKCLLGKCQ